MPEEKLSKIIELNEDLIENNENLAAQNKELFLKYNIKSFDIVGAIGAGKTALLEAISLPSSMMPQDVQSGYHGSVMLPSPMIMRIP